MLVCVQLEAWVRGAEARHGNLIKANRQMRCTLEKADKVHLVGRLQATIRVCLNNLECAVKWDALIQHIKTSASMRD